MDVLNGEVKTGKLIVIDGLDGSGKSTQLEFLDRYFKAKKIAYKQISFPDYRDKSSALVKMYLEGKFGNSVDSVNTYAASSFYAVDRYASYKRYWEKDYLGGSHIVAARYTTSNAIHQMVKLDQSEWDSYLEWLKDYEYAKLGLPCPDLVVFLDMPIEVSQKLLTGRYHGDDSKKDIHERDREYLKRCRKSALYAAEKLGWVIIPCSAKGEPIPIPEITDALICHIEKLLNE